MTRVVRMAVLCLVAGSLAVAAQPKNASTGDRSIAINGRVISMDGDKTYNAIRIENGIIAPFPDKPVPGAPALLSPQVIVPGFIDSHSHAISLLTAQSTGPDGTPNWHSLANVNVMELSECADLGSTKCFAPVTTQAEVEKIIRGANTNSAGWVLGWNYEPTRMTCGEGKFGFDCPNFANMQPGQVLSTLDSWRTDGAPVMITSESGHVVYVNSAGLKELNICTSTNQHPSCYQPIYNPRQEMRVAAAGQLDEDLALYAIEYVDNKLANAWGKAADPTNPKSPKAEAAGLGFFSRQIEAALAKYSSLGYTTVQEGAAGASLIDIYMLTAAAKPLPATMAFLEYDGTTYCDFDGSVRKALAKQKGLRDGKFDMFVAGMKLYADGSNQCFTGDMGPTVPYIDPPPIFGPGWQGLADYGPEALAEVTMAAHDGGLPIWVHTNGRRAQQNVLGVLTNDAIRKPGLRDVIVHFATPTEEDVKRAAAAGLGATFLINDYYFFYQPMCMQIVGPEALENVYPAAWAKKYGVPFGIHSDVSVTPPSAILGMWVANQRPFQRITRLPGPIGPCTNPATSPQLIDRRQALRAYTSDAAWLYGRDVKTADGPAIGSLKEGNAGDFVVLSDDPLTADDLTKVKVLMTVHNGRIVYEAPATEWKTATKKKKRAGK